MRLDFDGRKFADQCLHLMVLEEERVQCQPQGGSHRDCEGMDKMERGCESETTHGTSLVDVEENWRKISASLRKPHRQFVLRD